MADQIFGVEVRATFTTALASLILLAYRFLGWSGESHHVPISVERMQGQRQRYDIHGGCRHDDAREGGWVVVMVVGG